jgi:hypothetical protein
LFEYGAYQLQELSLTYSVSILMQFENSTWLEWLITL